MKSPLARNMVKMLRIGHGLSLFAVLLGLLSTGAAHGASIFVANDGLGTIGEYTTSGATVNASLITGLIELGGIESKYSHLVQKVRES